MSSSSYFKLVVILITSLIVWTLRDFLLLIICSLVISNIVCNLCNQIQKGLKIPRPMSLFLVLTVISIIVLAILDVKYVVSKALIAMVLNIIPNIGPVISGIFPISIALLDNFWKPLAVLGAYVIIQNIESYIIMPSIMKKKANLLPGITLISQFGFTFIFGPLGLILSLPLAVVIQVLIKETIKDI